MKHTNTLRFFLPALALLVGPMVMAQPCTATNSLTTTFAGGNGLDGNMFDITATNSVVINCFEIALSTGDATMQIWTKSGTHVGFETDQASWTQVGAGAPVTSAGVGVGTYIPISVGVPISSGSTQAFYITNSGTPDVGVDYTNGTTVGAVYASDANIQVLEGSGLSYPFGATSVFSPRNFNGIVHYSAGGTTGCTSGSNLTTTFAGGNGHDGVMFDVVATNSVMVNCFDMSFDAGTATMEIWTKTGTYVGFEATQASWTQVGTASATSVATGVGTNIPINVGVLIPSGATQAFYITNSGGTDPNVDYTNGTTVGSVLASDANLQVLEGAGFGYPFTAGGSINSPRNFNGTVYYTQAGGQGCASTDVLPTTLAAGNNQNGVMFDVTATNAITVDCFNANMDAGSANFEVYTRSGTHVGNETSQTGWTLAGSATGVSTLGIGMETNIPINVNVSIAAGATQAFYVTETGTGPLMQYTNGTTLGSVLASDGNASILEGSGVGYPFGMGGNLFSPRNFNGSMYYSTSSIGIEEVSGPLHFQMHPNPTQGLVRIEIPEFVDGSMSLKDITGKEILSMNIAKERTIVMDLSTYASGIYFVTMLTEKGSSTERLVLE